jgi:hypothetical protein
MPGKLPPPSRPPPRGSAPPSRNAPTGPPKGQPTATAVAAPTPAQRAARNASYALLGFTLLTVLSLVAWFLRADQPWGFASFIAVLTGLLGSGATALLWRQPTREHALAGLIVMGVSILRVGLPTDWTWTSVTLLTMTVLLAIPLVQAAILLPRS